MIRIAPRIVVTAALVAAMFVPSTARAEDTAPPTEVPNVRLAPAFPKLRFVRPVLVTNAGDGSNRLFVLEQYGRIMVFPNDPSVEKASVFLDLGDAVRSRNNEEGLLALAFHPDFVNNGYFYVHYSASEPRRGVLSRFRVDPEHPNRANRRSERVLMEIEQPWGNHNGCTMVFGPDGYLYVSLGDGGYANDPLNSGQDLSTLLGTILRIDVNHTDPGLGYAIPADNPFVGRAEARDEIWAYGLRNIWRMSFDRETGDLWAGDVGQNRWEEINLIVKGGNYGWNIREGKHPFTGRRQGQPSEPVGELIEPVAEYDHNLGISVTGGNVYRGSAFPTMRGVYLYADYVTGRMWGLRYTNGQVIAHREVLRPSTPPKFITSFGEDEAGEIFVCTFEKVDRRGSMGRLWRVEAR